MHASQPRDAAYRFDRFTLDLARGALVAEDGSELPLRAKSFALLRLLVENAGRLLDRDAIMAAVWPDVFVTDDSITQCVRDVRRALGDEAQRLLRTVPRRGYIFVTEVAPSAALVVRGRQVSAVPLGAEPGPETLTSGTAVIPPVQRRLAAILFADAEGFSGAMERDETGTWKRITKALPLMRKLVGDYRGQVIDEPGDALLALFHRPADALNFGLQVQREFRNEAAWSCGGQPLPFRIGINFGHVIEDRDRVYGHAVNVAERIQRRASPGGVCVSEAFRSAVGQEPAMRLHSLGQLRLEGIEERIELFAVETYDPPMPAASPFTPAQEPVRSPHEPAVVVLPFANLSDDTADEHFCVGIAADVIAGLTRFRNLLVIAPHSASVFKDSALPRERIAQRLGVRYLVSGSLQRAGDRLRLRVQLSETQGGVLWSEHYDGEMGDVFAFQDDTVTTVVARLGVRINDAERCRALRLRAPVLDAYGLVLRADDLVHRYRREANLHARRLLEQAVEADTGYGRAYAGLSRTFNHASRYRWAQDPARCLDRAAELARQAVERDGLDARGHAELGMALLHRKEHDASLAAYRYALKLNPNDADILADYAGALVCDGSARDALETLRHAMRLNPWCPDWYLWTLASAHFALGELGETVAIVRRMRDPSQGRRLLVASYAHLGMMCEAKAEAREILASQPDFTISDWAARLPHNRERVPFEHFVEGLRRAGLPTG